MLAAIRNSVLLANLFAVASSPQTAPSFRSNVELVTIPCAVVDSHGAPVNGLSRDEFRIFDNGTPRIVENLWLDTDQPLTLGIIIDASDSQREQIAEHRKTALDIAERIMRPGDRAFVVSVAEDVRMWADLTSAPSDIGARLSGAAIELFGPRCPKCGSTLLWDAIYDAARLQLRPLIGNKALLTLTDGFDSGSTHTWSEAAAEAQKSDATVYAIQYRSEMGGRYAPDLYRLVDAAGGATFNPPKGAYDPVVSRIESDLRRRYVLGFRPEKLSGKVRHEVRVEVTRPDLSVRARRTWFQVAQ